MNRAYRLESTELDSSWDEFVESSPNGTIFSQSLYLKGIDQKCAIYYCYKGKEIRAAVAVMESDDGKSAMFHDFVIYNGIMFEYPTYNQNRAQIYSEHFRISEFVAAALSEIYQNISISLHPSIIDVRPFLWHNYGTDFPKYYIDILYTSHIDISDFDRGQKLEDSSLFSECSSARRQEIRYAIKKGVITEERFDADLFVEFYAMTMKRQSKYVEQKVLDQMKKLISNLYLKNMGTMFIARTSNRDVGSMAFFCFDSKRAYYLFGANDSQLRDEHTGSAVLWDAFHVLSKAGIKEVDLEGVNSPQRGWFKLSFGGDIRAYYQMLYKIYEEKRRLS